MHRIVHLDLKGAPMKVSYLERVLLLVKSWGATGILLEWEDTFPYTGQLVDIGSIAGSSGDEMYSMEEVSHILQFAKMNGLEAIQLVQTIGHMEFVLKHPAFKGLRELPHSPAVLCPSKEESQMLVRLMVDQALNVQPDANYFHIGADEVWHTAKCLQCQRRASLNDHSVPSLFLEHIRNLTLYIKQNRPNLTVLMWDDMMRTVKLDTLRAYQVGKLVQPVVWDYSPKEVFRISPDLWENYRQLFPKVWAGSAFKGANGSCQMLSPPLRYVSNQEAWKDEIKKYGSQIHFAGVILTGWSRFDHYAALCELMPVSLPCLASCLRVLCCGNDTEITEVLPSQEWPGEKIARCVHMLVVYKENCLAFIHGDLVTTWLNPWQIENGYTNPVQVESVASTAQHLLVDMTALLNNITPELYTFTGPRSVDEWIKTFILPISKKLTEIKDVSEARCRADASVKPLCLI